MKMIKLSDNLSLSSIIQGFWRLCSWEWTAEELADFMNACIEGVDTMELEISVEDILNKRKIESDRIEFKTGWNPDDIYHSVCAFANDYNNDGGGYIVVGVEEENGIAKRPVKGLPEYMLDTIQKEMVGYNNMISPPYFPQGIPTEADGKWIYVIVARA